MRKVHHASVKIVFRLARRRIARFALVGGVCIPLNVGLLWLFHAALRMPIVTAWILAFEASTLCNFYANQRFTYCEQQHLRGWDWPKRALRAQLSSLVGVTINVSAFGLLLMCGVPYLSSDAAGIVVAFVVNFLLAERFVFTAPVPAGSHIPMAFGNPIEP